MNFSKKTILTAVSMVIIAIASRGADVNQLQTKNDLSTLNGNEKGVERFEGIFGRKFGEQMAVNEKDRVCGFDMNFYRVEFEAKKKSQTFTKYYLWVSEVTHKVFAIEACSGDDLSDALLTALEKKYKDQFTNSGKSYEMRFPKEACSLMLFKKVTFTVYEDGFGKKQVVLSVDGSRFGSEALRFTKCYRGFAVAKSDALFDMAKRESQVAKAEREKEDQLRKKLEVDNAADAF